MWRPGTSDLRQPNYYFQYDSQEFRDAYAMALKAPNEAEKTKWFGRCQEIIAETLSTDIFFQPPVYR